jgi:hypothetical protein
MKKTALTLALSSLLALGGSAFAELGTIDDVPAATLLLPYFEVDLDDDNGVTTLFSINNASATATVAHVTLWTDESVPTLDFDVYLTGYDVQTINLRDIFDGFLPRTADDLIDAGDALSNDGPLSDDIDFPGTTGPCGSPGTIYGSPALTSTLIAHINAAHTGNSSPLFGCVGNLYSDDTVARGYVTIDDVNQCNLSFPDDAGYFAAGGTGLASNHNTLWGDYFYVDQANNFAQGETLVHIEADALFAVPGDYTFYGRYVSATAVDNREPLATQFAVRYLNGGTFDGGTSLLVWRDAKVTVPGSGHACGGNFSWVPLNQADVVAFDEAENPTDLCFQGDNVSPPTGGAETCFPLETQRVSLSGGGDNPGADPTPPADFGWMFLNLNTTVAGGLFNPTAQAWVTVVMDASGRFSVGFDAIQLDNAFDTNGTSGVCLIPSTCT